MQIFRSPLALPTRPRGLIQARGGVQRVNIRSVSPGVRTYASSGDGASASAASPKLQQVLDAIDALNAADPRKAPDGQPYEVAYSRWLTEWVRRLVPDPSEELLIVARGQHVERFRVPRGDYPEGRAGYLKWRADLKRRHADTVARLMAAAGYGAASVDRARRLIGKGDLKSDAEAQAVEDALCLVFLERQFADLLAKEGADKMVDIVRKTWAKMGDGGRAAALKLKLPDDQAAVVGRALGG